MRGMLVAAAMLVATPAFADWEKIDEEVQAATRPETIYQLLDSEISAGAQFFVRDELTRRVAGLLPATITYLEVRLATYKWMGTNNSCDTSDPRQYVQADDGDLRFSTGGAGGWATGIQQMPAGWDPCAKHGLRPKLERTYNDTRK